MSFITVLPLANGLPGIGTKPGYAIAATTNGLVVDFFYFRDVLPDFAADGPGDGHWGLVMQAAADSRCSSAIQNLKEAGQLHAGVMSPTGFVELKRWPTDNPFPKGQT